MLWVRKWGEYNDVPLRIFVRFLCHGLFFQAHTVKFYFLYSAYVTMTDLSEAMPLLQKNIDANQAVWVSCGGKACTQVLEWGSDIQDWKTPDILLLADCVYYMEVYTI
jgi:hypothetical protein